MTKPFAAVLPAGPVDLEVETAFLGAILNNNVAMDAVQGFLRPDHFAEPVHSRIFEIATELRAQGKVANVLTIRPFLPADLRVGDFNTGQYLARIQAAATTVVNAIDFGRVLHDLASRRSIIALGATMMSAAEIGMNPRDVIADAEMQMLGLSEEATRSDADANRPTKSYAVIVQESEERAEAHIHYRGARTGLAALDNRTGGLKEEEFILLAARPSMGKTALALAIARRAASLGLVGVGFDSIEMSGEQIRMRLLADELHEMSRNITYKRINDAQIYPDEYQDIRRASAALERLPLSLIDKGNRLSDIPSHIRQARKECEAKGVPLGLFIIDYLGLIAPSERYAGNRVNEVTEISYTLKALAKREKLPIIALHQLNRANEARDDKRPRLSDLRDSGALEQDADMVMFVHREAYYIQRPGYVVKDGQNRDDLVQATKHQMEVIIDKNRQGPTGTVHLWCDMGLNAVRDVAMQEPERQY